MTEAPVGSAILLCIVADGVAMVTLNDRLNAWTPQKAVLYQRPPMSNPL